MSFNSKPHSIQAGLTLLEVIFATALLLVFSLVIFTPQEIIQRRQAEYELKTALHDMRGALDQFYLDRGERATSIYSLMTIPRKDGGGFYLRNFPLNPFTASTQWSIRATDADEAATIDLGWTFICSPQATLPLDAGIINIRVPSIPATTLSGVASCVFDDNFVSLNGIPYYKW
ncbi:MAG: hypothetical protein HQM08_02950 [Candidatus Riflebacteria bacterium]|nr:hypothetical protein [Candidatus Riflebacteria bacterium]